MAAQLASPLTEVLEVPPEVSKPSGPDISKPWPVQARVRYFLTIWAWKTLVTVALPLVRLLTPSQSRKIAPTYTKHYPVRPTLQCRVHLPKAYKPGTKLPLFIDIHGGGFALCDPSIDDQFCSYFANEFNFCVVAINYRKSPRHPFPVPVEDCTALAKAVLADEELPVDFNQVALGGFSAGGNLSLAIAQAEGIKERVHGLVLFYPSCDFTAKFRGAFVPDKDGREDVLKNMASMFNWAYVPAGIDRSQKTLSPMYATRQDLPHKMYFIAAEYDILCGEANYMAKHLAGVEMGREAGKEWDHNGIRWELVSDLQHGFTHTTARGAKGAARQETCKAVYKRIDDWLKKEVFT